MADRDSQPWDVLLLLDADNRLGMADTFRSLKYLPKVDMYECENSLVVTVELPGVRSEDINIQLAANDQSLRISGVRHERRDPQHKLLRAYQLEIYFGRFEREIVLPPNVQVDRDQITANYRDGFLVITLPRRERTRQGKHVIEIETD